MATPDDKTKRKDFKQEFLTCSICTHTFDDDTRLPKCLPCLHSFCRSCLRTYIARGPRKSEINCPICRKKCAVPADNGVDGFVTNFNVRNLRDYQNLHLQHDPVVGASSSTDQETLCTNCDSGDPAVRYCYYCEAKLCEGCTSAHTTWRNLKSHETVTLEVFQSRGNQVHDGIQSSNGSRRSRRPHVRCRAHSDNRLSAFCNTCHLPICDTCGITDHRDHEILNLDTAITDTVKTLQELATLVRDKKGPPLETLSGVIDSRINDINAAFTEQEKIIEAEFETLIKKLTDRREQAKKDLQDRCQVLTKLLQEQGDDVEALAAQCDSACDFAEQTCEYANPMQLFKHKEMVSYLISKAVFSY